MQPSYRSAVPARAVPARALAEARVRLCYLWRFGRLPDLIEAPRFTEQVQARKLALPDPAMTRRLDKLLVKDIVADSLGREWIVPTLWSGPVLPASNPFGVPAIVKARHGCNQNAVLRTAPSAQEWKRLRRRAARWTREPYGRWLDESAYFDVPRGIIAERLLQPAGPLPLDYKIYVFGGEATHVQVHQSRETAHRWTLCDARGTPLAGGTRPPLPASLPAMLEAAEALGDGFDFVRIDFYEVDGRPLFGEFSFYPGSGLDAFAADWIDFELGRLWRAAAAVTPRTALRRSG